MPIRRCGKLSRCDIRQRKNLENGILVLYLCCREVRLHLSIALESQLSSLCIRFALTLLSRSQAAPQHNFRKRVFKFCIRFALTLLSRSQAAPQHNFAPETDEKTIFLIDSHSAFFDILIPQKVRQEGLSETHACRCCSIRQSMYVWDFSAFVWQTKNSSTEPTWVVQWNCMKFGNSQD